MTVVIPCFNYAKYLPYAVNSVLTQVGVQVEVVIVDDASTDTSAEVARALASDDRVTAIFNGVNSGAVTTFNRGLDLVRSEFVVRLDADDMLTPGSLHRSVSLAREYPSVGLVYGRPVHFEGAAPSVWRESVRSWTVWSGTTWLEDRCRSGHNVITSPEVLMRMSSVELVGGQKQLEHAHDMEMWLRLAAVSDVGHVDGPDQAWHREHAHSLSNQSVDVSGLRMLIERQRAFDTLFAGVAGQLPGAARMHELANRALCLEALNTACHQYDRGRAEAGEIDALVEFAVGTGTEFRDLTVWRGLQRRRGTDGEGVRRPWDPSHALVRRARNEFAHRRWLKWGVYGD